MYKTIVPACSGCSHIVDGDKCSIWLYPNVKMKRGNCGMATHITRKRTKEEFTRVGQQKQKKKTFKK